MCSNAISYRHTNGLLLWKSKLYLSVRLALLVAAILSSVSQPARADTNWKLAPGLTGDWFVSENWWSGVPTGNGSDNAWIVNGSTAKITQPGAVCAGLILGHNNGSGNLQISDNGELQTPAEMVGAVYGGTLTQSGGKNTTALVDISSLGEYTLSGGTLQISEFGLSCLGTFSGGNGTGSLIADNCIVELSLGTLKDVGYMSVNMGVNTLMILPAGFNVAKGFKSYSSNGLTHIAGAPLTIPSGQGFSGIGSINDPVNCRGARINTSNSGVNLNNGLVLSGSGNANLGGGSLTINDTVSTMSGGLLSASNQYVGHSGTGLFAQSAGDNSISQHLYLGYNTMDNGTYNLSDTGQLSARYEWIGYSGTGSFTQSGGINAVSYNYGVIHHGFNSGSSGTYNLSAGQVSAYAEYVGVSGVGIFTQSGGTNTLSQLSGHGYLCLGYNSGSSGTYNLNGGTLILSQISKGDGTATFNFGGGTLEANESFSTTLPMTLTGVGGSANVDTAGYAVTFSGDLSGEGGLNKLGLGTLILSGVDTYTGNTTVSTGSLVLASSGSLLLDINNGGTSSRIVGGGAINLDGALVFDITDVSAQGSWNVLAVDTLTEIYGSSFGVKFAVGSNIFTATETSPGVWTYDIASLGNAIFTESTGTLSIVPEPGTLSLFAAGLLSLLAYVWWQERTA